MPFLPERRGERAVVRERSARRGGGARGERPAPLELERTEQRAAPQLLLGLDRVRHLRARRASAQTLARVPRERDGRREDHEPHEERHDARQGEPARAAQNTGAHRDDQRGDRRAEQQPREDLASPHLPTLPLDQLVQRHGTGRLVTA